MRRLAFAGLAGMIFALAGCSGGQQTGQTGGSAGIEPPLNTLAIASPGEALVTQTEVDGASRQVIYRGVDGPGLFLGYRDSAGNGGDYNFDLRSGYVIRLGNARIAVVDVSDEDVHYRVLAGF